MHFSIITETVRRPTTSSDWMRTCVSPVESWTLIGRPPLTSRPDAVLFTLFAASFPFSDSSFRRLSACLSVRECVCGTCRLNSLVSLILSNSHSGDFPAPSTLALSLALYRARLLSPSLPPLSHTFSISSLPIFVHISLSVTLSSHHLLSSSPFASFSLSPF